MAGRGDMAGMAACRAGSASHAVHNTDQLVPYTPSTVAIVDNVGTGGLHMGQCSKAHMAAPLLCDNRTRSQQTV